MRSLKSTTSTTTTLKGKRKLAQSKEYPESPPTTPPNGKSTTTRGKKRVSEVNSPPSKRRRSSDRIANKTGQKRTSMEDDDGFVFTRAPKQKRKVAEVKEVSTRPAKPFVMDFTAETPVASSNPFQPSRQPKRTPPQTDSRMAIKDTVVALPISDTPIIRRNQDLRQQAGGRRRSSLSLRGNRTSSIGNGFEALPHPDVAHEDFHKHIKVDLPEPVRMKQLLAWCARRALDEQKTKYALTESSNAAAIARVIEEEILRDLIENRISTSWYHRQESSDGTMPVMSVKKQPHPQNLENLRKIQLCEERLDRLKKEQEAWPQILKSMSAKVHNPPSTSSDIVDSNLIRPIEASFLRTLEAQHVDMANANRDIKSTTQSGELEFQIDRLYQSLHTVNAFTEVADKFSSRVLEEAEKVLADREKRAEKQGGTEGWDVQKLLRQVTRV